MAQVEDQAAELVDTIVATFAFGAAVASSSSSAAGSREPPGTTEALCEPPPSSSAGEPEVPPPPVATFSRSEKGYVTGIAPPHNGAIIGKVTTWGKNISAVCRMNHGPECKWIKTSKWATLDSMSEWLVKGRPVPWDAPIDEKRAAAKEHQLARVS